MIQLALTDRLGLDRVHEHHRITINGEDIVRLAEPQGLENLERRGLRVLLGHLPTRDSLGVGLEDRHGRFDHKAHFTLSRLMAGV